VTDREQSVLIAMQPRSDPLPNADRERLLANPGFGLSRTDHMVTFRWSEEQGWHDGRLVPYAPLSIDPATMGLHYGQSIFEGLKAHRNPAGLPILFRPRENAARFQRSATRLAMPEMPTEIFVAAVEALVRQDCAWIPEQDGASLYLRPFLFASEVGIGLRPATEYLFLVIASPAGPYFADGVQPVSVWISEEYVRASPGGTGAAKCAGNYAASMIAQKQAHTQGCDQVVWLDAVERRWIEEMGAMNLCFVFGTEESARVVTPALTGSLLSGVTRESLLTIASDLGLGVEERRISVDEWRDASAAGEITEVFACGTAAAVTPVGTVKSPRASWTVGNGDPGPVTLRLREALLTLQTGRRPDPYGWIHPVC
jgi:branched-chain amino acid aminotransferase